MSSPQTLNQLIKLTSNVTNAFTTALFQVNRVDRTLTLREFHSLSQGIHTGAGLRFGEGPIGMAAETEQPVLMENFTGDSAELKIYQNPEDLKGLIVVPVKRENLVGILMVDTKESYHFSLRTQKIISELANLMPFHLDFEFLEREERDLDAFPTRELIQYTHSIADSIHPAAMAERLTRIPGSLLQFDAIAVIWMEEDQKTGKVVHHQGWDHDLSRLEVVPGKGLAGSTIKNRVPIVISDMSENRSTLFKEGEVVQGYRSILSVPVIFKNHLLSVLVCASLKENEFTQSHLDLLDMLGTFAAPALFYAREKRQWDYDKNLDQITGIPNHRCLVAYRENIEKEVLQGQQLIFFLSIHLKNLLHLYESNGVVLGDQLLKQVVSMLSKVVPSPKFLFKYSDTCFLIILLKVQRQDVEVLETKLKHVFDKTPFFVEGRPMTLETEMGLSVYPEEGANLCELAGLSWARASQNLNATHD